MASVTAKGIPEVQSFFTELWNLYKKHYVPEKEDEYWNAVISDFTELRNKYKELIIAKPMISILLQELEIRSDTENYKGKSKDFKNKKLSSKEKLTILAEFLVDTCTHEEIDIFCIAMLDANLKCRSNKYISTNGGVEVERNKNG